MKSLTLLGQRSPLPIWPTVSKRTRPVTPSSTSHTSYSRVVASALVAALAHAAEAVSTYVPTRTAPAPPMNGASQRSASGSQFWLESHWPWPEFFSSQLKRTDEQSIEGTTNEPPGCTHPVKSQMGTPPQLAPRSPL